MQGYQVQTVPIGVLVDLFKPFHSIGLPYELVCRSFSYWMPSEVPEDLDERVREAVWGEAGDGVFSPGQDLTEEELLEQGRGGRLRVFGCTVVGKAWADENRPPYYEHDGGEALD